MNVKDLVKDGKVATFVHYKLGEMWYVVDDFHFPIPVYDSAEVGDATFHSTEKALILMRYIRKHIEFIENARKDAKRILSIEC